MNSNTAESLSYNRSLNSEIDWDAFTSSALIEVNRSNKVFTSSAVVIKRNVLLTAAHSVAGVKSDEGYVHLATEYNKTNVKIKFKKIIIHPDYNKEESNFKNDIAIIILDKNLPDSIKPINIAFDFHSIGKSVDRIGFGGRSGKNTRTWTNPFVVNLQDGVLELEDNMSVVGDSGGPIYTARGLVGIHSTLEGLNKTYAVYVPKYIDWIENQMPLKEVNL